MELIAHVLPTKDIVVMLKDLLTVVELAKTGMKHRTEVDFMIDKRIKFDERYDSEAYGTTTLYFVAPKELLKKYIPTNDYPDAVSMEISIEFPTEHIEPYYAGACVSPTRKIEDVAEDYDWHDVQLSYDEIEELLRLAENQ